MSNPPHVNPFRQHLFDNPWPVIVFLGLAAVVLFVLADRRQQRGFLVGSLLCLVLAAVVFFVERIVVTTGERASEQTRALVEAAGNAEVARAASYFANDATMSLVSPGNPGVGIDEIRSRLQLLENRYRLASNLITGLDSFSVSASEATVHLHVRSELETEVGIAVPVSTSWIIRFEEQSDGELKVKQITFVNYDGRPPSQDIFK